jgi:phosphopentomutase
VSNSAFPLYPNGFPKEVIDQFIAETGCKQILGNKPASGTDILNELGPEHQKTGYPIVYTSGDSVFQIACDTQTVPLETLYEWSRIARKMLDGEHRVGRVIARPFVGEPGNYKRLSGERRDFAVPPPAATLLDRVVEKGMGVLGIGKIEDIFSKCGITHAVHTAWTWNRWRLKKIRRRRLDSFSPTLSTRTCCSDIAATRVDTRPR